MAWRNSDRDVSSRMNVVACARAAMRSTPSRMSSTSSRSSRSIHSAAAPIERPLETAANRYGARAMAIELRQRSPRPSTATPSPSREAPTTARAASVRSAAVRIEPCHVVQSDRTDHPDR